jgi:hypothetical protein
MHRESLADRVGRDMALRALLENMVAEAQMAQRVGHPATPAEIVGASWDAVIGAIRDRSSEVLINAESARALRDFGISVGPKAAVEPIDGARLHAQLDRLIDEVRGLRDDQRRATPHRFTS